MKRRLWILLVAVAAGIALGWWLTRRAAPTPPAPGHVSAPVPKLKPPLVPAPVPPPPVVDTPATVMPTAITPPPVTVPGARPTVRIQDGKTIDFSSGQPVVKDSGDEKAIIDAAVKEMDEAAKNVRFKPTATTPEEKKKPASPPATPSGG